MVTDEEIKDNVDVAIIICTYNREELLLDCIDSFIKQEDVSKKWRIIVVNNYVKDFSSETSKFLQANHCTVIHEPSPGLSKARNAGLKESMATWLGFVDDDAKVPSHFISQAFANIEQRKFDCFGGAIVSWWKYGQPRWLQDSFGSKPKLSETRITLEEGYNWGSNIFIKRKALLDIGGFPERIGMQGNHIGYAAENIVQIALRKENYTIGYDPNLMLQHVVMPHKLKLSWHIKAAYAEGRDANDVFPNQYKAKGFFISLKKCVTQPIRGFFKWISEKDFYWENFVLTSCIPFANLTGKLRSFF